MLWDDDKRSWSLYFLDDELKQVSDLEQKQRNEPKGNHSNAKERKVADRTYYDLLEVSTDASQTVIKRSYYKAARKCHPDKRPNDLNAREDFQALGHAYQMLSNEQTRAHYDKHGIANAGDGSNVAMQEIDPFIFFAVMFGSEAVHPYIGELWIANKTERSVS